MTRSLADVFDANAARAPEKVAVSEDGREVSYGVLRTRSEAVTRTLESLGVRAGSRVGLMVPNSSSYVAGYFAIARPGGVVAPLNVRYRTQELVYYLDDTKAGALVVSPDLVEVAREALATMPRAPRLVEIDDAGGSRVLDAASPVAPADDAVAGPAPDDPPLMHQYTSGSTGNPKRVVRTHGQLRYELAALAETFHLGPEDRFLGEGGESTPRVGIGYTLSMTSIPCSPIRPTRLTGRRNFAA